MNNNYMNNYNKKNKKILYSNKNDKQELICRINDLEFKIDSTLKYCKDLINHLNEIIKVLDS